MKKLLIILIVNTFLLSANAAEFYTFVYTSRTNDSFERILKLFTKKNVKPTYPKLKKLREMNPSIKNWQKIPKSKKISLYFEKSAFNMRNYKRYKKYRQRLSKKKNISPLHIGLLYSAAMTSLNQVKSSQSIDTELTQNSPLSLGFEASYKITKKYLISSKASYSYLQDSTTDDGEEITLDNELLFNSYLHYNFNRHKLAIYSGLEYESFNTIDLEHIANTKEVLPVNNNVFYLTLGLNKSFNLGSKVAKTDFSFSNIVTSSSDTSQSYKGFKAIMGLDYLINDQFEINTQLSVKQLTGSDDMNAMKVSLGLSYKIY